MKINKHRNAYSENVSGQSKLWNRSLNTLATFFAKIQGNFFSRRFLKNKPETAQFGAQASKKVKFFKHAKGHYFWKFIDLTGPKTPERIRIKLENHFFPSGHSKPILLHRKPQLKKKVGFFFENFSMKVPDMKVA